MIKLVGNGNYTIAEEVQYATVVANTHKYIVILTQQSCLPILLIH